jgi:hypothetical protein
MPFYTGRTAALKISGTTVGKVRDWSLDTSVNMLDTTSMGDVASSSVPGLFSGTGSATLSYYNDSTTALNITDLIDNINKTSSITTSDLLQLTFEVGPSQLFTASGYVTSASISASIDEVTTASLQFTLSGPLTTVTISGTT